MKICTVSKLGNRIIYQVWGGDMSEFKKKKLQKLNLYVLARINENKNKEFEKAHYQKVKIYAEMLAKRRNLDVNRALVSAMLHDIGRIQPDSSKRKHAEVSAKIAYTILQNNGMKNNSSKKIAKDISKHSFKSQIGNPYEELLKDADSLAHQDEFGLQALSLPEKMRCELAEVCNMEFYLIPPDHMMWSDILWNKIKIILKCFNIHKYLFLASQIFCLYKVLGILLLKLNKMFHTKKYHHLVCCRETKLKINLELLLAYFYLRCKSFLQNQ